MRPIDPNEKERECPRVRPQVGNVTAPQLLSTLLRVHPPPVPTVLIWCALGPFHHVSYVLLDRPSLIRPPVQLYLLTRYLKPSILADLHMQHIQHQQHPTVYKS